VVDHAGERRLAAILAADVVGYSRLMGEDEAGTLAAVRLLRSEVIEPRIVEHKGRLFKAMGDGFLAEFPSVVNAVACAAAVQKTMAARNADLPEGRQMALRIGVHLGDIIAEGGDLFGDGVNIAARIESLAPAGGVAISAMVRDNIGSRLDLGFEDMGEQKLKNITKPLRIYRLAATSRPPVHTRQPEHSKPSIAVLPFTNMSGDPEQEYFADGIVEDIITALSRFGQLFVIARNSTFTYKGKAVDIKQVGRELGVRYVLEGSVRRAGNRVRITGQLIDAGSGTHLWADRFDGELSDIFDLQDQVTTRVVGAIAPRLEQAEIERAHHKPTANLDAYDNYLRGKASLNRWTKEANAEALAYFLRTIDLDPESASAYGNAARCYVQRKIAGWTEERREDIAETTRLARRAAELGKDDAVALCTAAMAMAFVVGDLEEGEALATRALELNPNLARTWLVSGTIMVWLGREPDLAIEHTQRALRLSPRDSQAFAMKGMIALAHFFAGRNDKAQFWAESAQREQPNFPIAICVAAASAALAGRRDDAQKAIMRLAQVNPKLRVSNIREFMPIRRSEHLNLMAEGLRKAGLS
jgi:TolB-like protein